MRLTLHCDYGLRILVYLAAVPERTVSTAEIGQAYGISKHHLVRVAQSLRAGGFIELAPGRTGGLTLARRASDIRVGDVVRELEPELKLVECFDRTHNTCPIAGSCGLSGILHDALTAFLASLDEHTIADVLARSGPRLRSSFLPISALTRRTSAADPTPAPRRRAGASRRRASAADSAPAARRRAAKA